MVKNRLYILLRSTSYDQIPQLSRNRNNNLVLLGVYTVAFFSQMWQFKNDLIKLFNSEFTFNPSAVSINKCVPLGEQSIIISLKQMWVIKFQTVVWIIFIYIKNSQIRTILVAPKSCHLEPKMSKFGHVCCLLLLIFKT